MAWWFLAHVTGLIDRVGYLEPIGRFTCASESILAEYRLRSFSPWLASISLDAAVGGNVVQDPAQVIFIISKNSYSTKPTVYERNVVDYMAPKWRQMYSISLWFFSCASLFPSIPGMIFCEFPLTWAVGWAYYFMKFTRSKNYSIWMVSIWMVW